MMHTFPKVVVIFMLFVGGWSASQAAPREAAKNDGAVLKLQAMVKSLTAERDAAKAEAAKLAEDLQELEQLKKAHSAAVAAKEQISSELSAQRNSNGEVRERLEKTNTRLSELIEKHKEVSQAKADLQAQLSAINAKQQATEQQLGVCDTHNVKLYEAAKELLERYENKGALASVLQNEALLQFNSVEMETIVQEYEDKLSAGKYQKQSAADSAAAPASVQ
jgi:chromosome segregation ATPase